MDAVVVAVLVGSPWVAAALAAVLRRRDGMATAARGACWVTAAGFVASVIATVRVLTGGPLWIGIGATGLNVDTLAVFLGMLVLGLSALIQSFAVRYLRGDARQGWFVVWANVLTGCTVALVCAGSLLVFAVSWVAAGAALVALLATYRSPQAGDGVRRLAIRLGIADSLFLVGVAVLLVANGGDARLSELGGVTDGLSQPVQLAVAALLVTGALARSSQIPFQGWLPFTLAAPTPVSALLHAGVVNAGAILLLRFAPVIAQNQVIMLAIFALGAATLLYATAVRLARPDVKGRLVFSTMAQMGFMIMACGLGAFPAAIFHLIAHSLYKSSLFLGAGTGVRSHAVLRDLPARQPVTRSRRAAATVIAIALPVTAIAAVELIVVHQTAPASLSLLVFLAVTAIVTLSTALTTRFSPGTVLIAAGSISAVIIGYTIFLAAFSSALDPVGASAPAPAWLLVVPALGLAALELLSRGAAPLSARARTYTRSLTASIPRLHLDLNTSKGLHA